MSTKVEQRLQWRRDKVRELSVKGYSQRHITTILKVGLASVNEDLQYITARARDHIRYNIDEYLPAEYENCLDGLNNILTEAWQMSLEDEKWERAFSFSPPLQSGCGFCQCDITPDSMTHCRFTNTIKRLRPIDQNGYNYQLT